MMLTHSPTVTDSMEMDSRPNPTTADTRNDSDSIEALPGTDLRSPPATPGITTLARPLTSPGALTLTRPRTVIGAVTRVRTRLTHPPSPMSCALRIPITERARLSSLCCLLVRIWSRSRAMTVFSVR